MTEPSNVSAPVPAARLRAASAVLRDQRGITGLETAIVLIAFVVVASVFAFAVLTTGLLSAQKTKSTIAGSVAGSAITLQIRGSVEGYSTSTPGTIERLVIPVIAGGGDPVDLSDSSLVVIYFDTAQLVDLPFDTDAVNSPGTQGWATTFNKGTGPVLNVGERAEITVNITSLTTLRMTS